MIFCAGNINIAHTLINQYINSDSKSIELLKKLAIELFNDKFMLEILVGSIKDNKTIVYQISSYNNFEIVEKTVKRNETGLWSGGIKTNECFNSAYEGLIGNKSITHIYQNTFNHISYEGIGGVLNIFKLDINKVNLIYSNNIIEKPIKRLKCSERYLINAEILMGKTIIANDGLFDGIEVYDGGVNPVVEIGKYMDGIIAKRGIRIVGGSFEIIGGLPSSQLDPTYVSSVNTGITNAQTSANNSLQPSTLYNGVKIDSTNGLVVQKTNGTSTLTAQTILNATDGIKIQKNTGTYSTPVWVDKFYVDTNGIINAEDLITKNIKIKSSDGTKTLVDGTLNKIDFTGFDVITGKENVLKGIDIKNTSNVSTFTVDTNGNVAMAGNVTLGSGSSIAWANVTSKPSIPSQYTDSLALQAWVNSGYATSITSVGVYTGILTAAQINATNITTLSISGTLNCGNSIKIGASNASGFCYLNTATDGVRLVSHAGGNYMKVNDNGDVLFFTTYGGTEHNYGTIYKNGTTDLISTGSTYIAKFA